MTGMNHQGSESLHIATGHHQQGDLVLRGTHACAMLARKKNFGSGKPMRLGIACRRLTARYQDEYMQAPGHATAGRS